MTDHSPVCHKASDKTPLDADFEAQIDAALEAASHASPSPRGLHVEFLSQLRAFSLHINNGQRLLIPAEDLQWVSAASDDAMQAVKLLFNGEAIDFPSLDVQFSIEGLLAGRRGNERWMQQLEASRAAALQSAA